MSQPSNNPKMIGANRRNARPGGFITRRKPHHKMSMHRVKQAATGWLNVHGPEMQFGFHFDR